MRTFSINTLGCKVNQYESQQIREFLERLGLDQLDPADICGCGESCDTKERDLVVINTCCVTLSASAKSRQYIRRAQRLNPGAIIIVAGCLPTVQIGKLSNLDKNIHLVRYRDNLASTLSQVVGSKTVNSDCQDPEIRRDTIIKTENRPEIKCKTGLTNQPKLPQLTSFKGHTRAFLKIQDGCDGSCSYCIIPKTRPNVQNKPVEEVLEEAQRLVKAGHKEIVVTGIFLGAYGQTTVRRKKWANQQNDKLAELLDKMVKIPNLARIRLSSLEPGDITGRLLDTFCKYRNIMPHIHLSLQSGSNQILKKMCRQYRADEFREKIELIKSRLDRPAITADFIVGFPGETDADFQQTVDLAKEIDFAKMHIFGFSPRKGTTAAAMQDTVDTKVIKERSQILRDLGIELGYKFRQQFIGETDTILVETPVSDDGAASGRSERYFMVQIEKTERKIKKNELVKVKLVENRENRAIGEVVMENGKQPRNFNQIRR